MAEGGGIGSRVRSKTQAREGDGSYPPPPPSPTRGEEIPPTLSWLELQQEWLQLHRFRYCPNNFYSYDRKKDHVYGSEYEQATIPQRRCHGTNGPVYKKVRDAIQDLKLPTKCACHQSSGKDQPKCRGDSCILRSQLIECDPKVCDEGCFNQRIQKKEFAKCLTVECRDTLGKCLVTTDIIKKDELVIEYVGIITIGKLKYQEEYAYPLEGIHRDEMDKKTNQMVHHEFYLSTLKFGTESHFVRHPLKGEKANCKIEPWRVKDQKGNFLIRLIVVALHDIPKSQPITVFFPQHDKEKYPTEFVAQEVTNRELVEFKASMKHHKIDLDNPTTQITEVLKDVEDRKKRYEKTKEKCDKLREKHINKEAEASSTSSEDLSNWDEDIKSGINTLAEGIERVELPPGVVSHIVFDDKQQDDRMFCKYDANGLRSGDKGFKPCNAAFDDVYAFRKHVKDVHGSAKCGCKMFGCGRVFNSNKEAENHFHDRHGMKIPDQPDTNDLALFLEYFFERVKYGRAQGRAAVLQFDPAHPEFDAKNPNDRRNDVGALQDRLEMERFEKFAKTEQQKDIHKQVKSIMEKVQLYTTKHKEVVERERQKKQRKEEEEQARQVEEHKKMTAERKKLARKKHEEESEEDSDDFEKESRTMDQRTDDSRKEQKKSKATTSAKKDNGKNVADDHKEKEDKGKGASNRHGKPKTK